MTQLEVWVNGQCKDWIQNKIMERVEKACTSLTLKTSKALCLQNMLFEEGPKERPGRNKWCQECDSGIKMVTEKLEKLGYKKITKQKTQTFPYHRGKEIPTGMDLFGVSWQ